MSGLSTAARAAFISRVEATAVVSYALLPLGVAVVDTATMIQINDLGGS
jgi:hypothetical protein